MGQAFSGPVLGICPNLPQRAVVGIPRQAYSSDRIPMSSITSVYVAVSMTTKIFADPLRGVLPGIQPIAYGSAALFIADTRHPQFALKRYTKKNSIGA
jgi:hypothetical protein